MHPKHLFLAVLTVTCTSGCRTTTPVATAPGAKGGNGWDYYVQAGETLRRGGYGKYAAWANAVNHGSDPDPTPPPGVRPGMSALEVKRVAVDKFRSVLAIMAEGNRYPIHDPNAGDLTFSIPRFVQIKDLAKFTVDCAEVDVASKRSDLATGELLDAWTMSRRYQQDSLMKWLVGGACQSIVMKAFDELMPNLSVADAKRISTECKAYVSTAHRLVPCLEAEKPHVMKLLDMSSSDGTWGWNDFEEGLDRWESQWKALSRKDRDDFQKRLRALVNKEFDDTIRELRGPMRAWTIRNSKPAQPTKWSEVAPYLAYRVVLEDMV